jgi:hypothetical protein
MAGPVYDMGPVLVYIDVCYEPKLTDAAIIANDGFRRFSQPKMN